MDPFTYFLIQVVVAVVLLAISYAITASMARRQPAKKPAALEEFDFPQDAEGTAQSVVFGQGWVKGWTVLWFGNYRVEPIRKKGGKK
jgi:flagellar biosynthesis/type III secretory pathway M-ring protein FliF/YscJ